MTAEQFKSFWSSAYPDTPGISYLFKIQYQNRWFRIHSLPGSKRYAENDGDWDILLDRQNTLITDLIGEGATMYMVTGRYNFNDPAQPHITQEEPVFQSYSFTRLEDIDLNLYSPAEYLPGEVYRPAFAELVWHSGLLNSVLKEIAEDNVRAFFVSIDKHVIVAPYDGGVDIILKDETSKEFYKDKYSDWLSDREDGL